MKGESADKTRVALLPGLDGTGENFAPIIPHLEQACSVQVIRYTNEQTFNDYVRSAERQLSGNNPVSLVAESFSGPIAISLIRRQPWQYLPSVLVATFCRSPQPILTGLAGFTPDFIFGDSWLNRHMMDWFVMDQSTDQETRQRAHALLDELPDSVLKQRSMLLDHVDVRQALSEIDLPLLYIRATEDHVVGARHGVEMRNCARNLKVVELEGPHMILQSRPRECADIITSFLNEKTPITR